jgi:pimeloyl-ACP methyl ester carboxylesterase
MVALGDHRVHLSCDGSGPTTVLLLHGTPRFSFHFALVQPEVAKFARVCVYDRAGDAWSDPVPGQPTAAIFLEELDQVARHLSPRGPLVLVGHSIGGVLARAYYAWHPDRVAAMVLIDTPALPVSAPPRARIAMPLDKLPARFHETHRWATAKWERYAQSVNPMQAMQYQRDLFSLAGQARSATLPVWFLHRAEPSRRMIAPWGRAEIVRVENSSHDIQLDQPGLVIEAIRQALARTNAK